LPPSCAWPPPSRATQTTLPKHELLADEGHEFADLMIADEAGNEPPEVLSSAKEIHAAFVRFGVGANNEGVG
jgi:hypothetical protein